MTRAAVYALVGAITAGLAWYLLASSSGSFSMGRREAVARAIVELEQERSKPPKVDGMPAPLNPAPVGGSARQAYLARTLVIDAASTAISDDGRLVAQSDGQGSIAIRDLEERDASPLWIRKAGATGLRWLLTVDPNRKRLLSYTSSLGELHVQTLTWDAPGGWVAAAKDQRLVVGVAGTLPWVVEPLSAVRVVVAGQTKQSDGTVANVMQVLDLNNLKAVASAKGASPVVALAAVAADRWLAGTAQGSVVDMRSDKLSDEYDAASKLEPTAEGPIVSLAVSRDQARVFALDQSGVVYSAALTTTGVAGWRVIARSGRLQDLAGSGQ